MQGMYVHHFTPDVARARKGFEGPAEGGTIEQAGQETFWSPFLGVCRDRFGTPWQVSAEAG